MSQDRSPAQRIGAAAEAVGESELARRCGEVLATGDCDDDLLEVLGGHKPGFVYGEHKVDQSYWIPTWALRGLLYVWDDSVAPQVVRALDHEHWRVREMAAKVAAKREIGAAAESLAALATDEVARVQAAAARGLGVVGEAEHADAVRALLDDEDEAVRDRAEQALTSMSRRLDRDLRT